jgi:hypothetical protein
MILIMFYLAVNALEIDCNGIDYGHVQVYEWDRRPQQTKSEYNTEKLRHVHPIVL